MVGFSHAINNLKPFKNIKQEEILPEPDFPEYSIPVVDTSIPDFDFIDEWLRETDSMDTEVSPDGGCKPIEVNTEQFELLGSIENPIVQETCKESSGVDSSIEMALEKVSLIGTSESSDIVNIKVEAEEKNLMVSEGEEKNLMVSEGEEKNLMVSEGGANGVSLVDDSEKSHNNVHEGYKESSVIVKDGKDGVDSSIEMALEKVSLVGTSESSDIVDIKGEAVVTSGDDSMKSHNTVDTVDKSDEESSETVKDSKDGVDSSIEMALDTVDVKGEAVVTSGGEQKNLMVIEGGANGVSLADDSKLNNIIGGGDKESIERVKDSKDGDDDSSESESEDDEDEDDDESEDESSSSSESSDEEEEEEMMAEVEEGEIKELEELIGESDGDEEGFAVKGPIKSKNEVQDLPPVPKVDVTLEPHHQTLPVGVVLSIMDAKVIVEGVEKHNPLNEGSILWITENRSVLGLVDEIFGPVKNPYYIVRYNSKEEVPAGISQGTLISFVVEFADHVLNDKNIYKKGYDASGENDEELTDEAEFSDDEKEAEYKRMQRMSKRGPSDDTKHGKRDFVDKKKFQQKPRTENNTRTSFPPSNVPPHQLHGGSGSSPSPFGTGMANAFRPPFGPSTSQVPQAHIPPHQLHGSSSSSPSPFGTGMTNDFRPPFGSSTSQVPQPHSGLAPQQHPPRPNNWPASQQHPLPSNMGPPPQQHPLNMGPPPQQHPLNMGPPPQQHPLNMGPPLQQHPLNMGPPPQQHPLPSNMVWPNGQPYQNVGFPNGFPMNAMPYVPYQQPQHLYQPQMFTGFSSGPPMPQQFDPSQRPVLGPMAYGPSNIPAGMPMFMSQPGFNQGPTPMGFQGYPPRPHMNPGEQGVPSQGSINETHINVGEQGANSQGQGPLNEPNNGAQPPSTQGNFPAQNRFNSRGAARGRRPYRRGNGRGRH